MTVRRLGPEDAGLACQAIVAIKQPFAPSPPTPSDMERFLSRPENVLIAASEEGKPTGFLLAYILDRVDQDRPMVCLYEIEVAEPYRRQGSGRAMVEKLLGIARDIGAVKTWVIASRSDTGAMAFYRRTGAVADPEGDDVIMVYRR